MKLSLFIKEGSDQLLQKGISSARLDVELIVSKILGIQRGDLFCLPTSYCLRKKDLDICQSYLNRRSKGEPLAYIFEEKEFFLDTFRVSKDVLIPRPETELLVEEALNELKRRERKEDIVIADFGTGSGCIGLSIAKHHFLSKLYAIDLSEKALKITKVNAQRLNVLEKTKFINKNVNDLTKEDFDFSLLDLIVANPPYLSFFETQIESHVKEYEPHMALFSGEKGTELLTEWSLKAKELLKDDAIFYMEISHTQGDYILNFLSKQGGYRDIELFEDYSHHSRFIKAIRTRG